MPMPGWAGDTERDRRQEAASDRPRQHAGLRSLLLVMCRPGPGRLLCLTVSVPSAGKCNYSFFLVSFNEERT